MAEPTSAYSFEYLITKVAKEAGLAYYGAAGNEKAMPPIDVHDLELCKDIVNDGIKSFIADAPRTGWRWRDRIMAMSIDGTRITGTADSASATTIVDATLAATYTAVTDLVGYYCYITGGTGIGSWAVITAYDPTGTPGECTVADWLDEYGNAGGTDPAADSTFAITVVETVGGDVSRYPLPEDFNGEASGQIHYASSSAHSTRINWVGESYIRQLRSVNVTTTYPNKAAIRPLEPRTSAMDPKRRYELILDPQPVSADVLEFPYKLTFNKLDIEVGLGDSGSNTTLVDGERTEGDDYFNGWRIEIISGTGKGSWALVTGYTGASGTFTVADWLTAAGAGGGTNPGLNSVYTVRPLNNLHPAGYKFDLAILSSCLAQAEIEVDDIASGYVNKYMKKDLPKAYEADARSAPRNLGTMNRGRAIRERTWNNVTYS